MSLALGIASVALLVAIVAAWRAFLWSPDGERGVGPPYDDGKIWEAMVALENQVLEVRGPVADIELWKNDLNLAVAQGIAHVDRAENRIRSTVKRARKELESHGLEWAGLEAEATDLREADGGGGTESELPTVPENVEPRGPTTIPGVPGVFSAEDVMAFSGD